mgnify:CR=1 FL=1
MTVRDITKFLRTDEELTLYDVAINSWRTGVITKEYIPPAYLDWEMWGIQTDLDGSTPVLELDIKKPATVSIEQYDKLHEKYKRVLENAHILNEALKQYQEKFGDIDE